MRSSASTRRGPNAPYECFTQFATVLVAMGGVGGLVHGSITLLYETQIALKSLAQQEEAIRNWLATHPCVGEPPVGM